MSTIRFFLMPSIDLGVMLSSNSFDMGANVPGAEFGGKEVGFNETLGVVNSDTLSGRLN